MDAKAAAEARRQRILNAGARRMAVVKGEADSLAEQNNSGAHIREEKSPVALVSPTADSGVGDEAIKAEDLGADAGRPSDTAPDKATAENIGSGSPVVAADETCSGNADRAEAGGASTGQAKRVLAKRREKIALVAASVAALDHSASSKSPKDMNPEEVVPQKVSSAPKRTSSEENFLNQAFHEAVSSIDAVEPESVKRIKETMVNRSTDRAAAVVFADPPVPTLPKPKSRPRMISAADFKRICQILVIVAISIANGFYSHRRLGTHALSGSFKSPSGDGLDDSIAPVDESLQELQRFLSVNSLSAPSSRSIPADTGGEFVGDADPTAFDFSTQEVPLQTRLLRFLYRWAVFFRENVFLGVGLSLWCLAPMIAEPVVRPVLLLCGVFVCDDASGGGAAGAVGGIVARLLSIALGGIGAGIGGVVSAVLDYVGMFALHVVLSLGTGAAFAVWNL